MAKKLDDILVENSTYANTHDLKNRLVREEILEYKCNKCNNDGIWMEEKLSLQLHHKNGVHNDNRINNLELLCPNCHSITDTYAGKSNKGIKKPKQKVILNNCLQCKKLTENQSYCSQVCFKLSLQKVTRPNRDILKHEIRTTSFIELSRKYGVSDNAIRKWCIAYKLPTTKKEIKSYSDEEWLQI